MNYTGVYWMGHVYDKGGYGNASRNFLKSLESAGIPVYIHPVGSIDPEIGEEQMEWMQRLSTAAIGDKVVFIRHSLPGIFTEQFSIPNVIKQIGVTIFETDRIPSQWVYCCNQMDEIWVPSRFNYTTFSVSGVDPNKLKIVPYAIDQTIYYPNRPYKPFSFPPGIRSFVFLYVFAFDYRKGYDMLIQAFCEEFSPFEDVSLLIKVYVYMEDDSNEKAAAEIRHYIPFDRAHQIFVIVDSFTEEQMLSLYLSSDCYISMDRACGWGMPIMEMMALGKPVIAIDWGGSTEYMSRNNSFMIDSEPYLVPVNEKLQRARPAYYLHHQWAEVNVNQVKRVMREAYLNPRKREQFALQAANDIHTKYSPYAIGKVMESLLGNLER